MSRTFKDKKGRKESMVFIGKRLTPYAGKGSYKEEVPKSTGNPHGKSYGGFKLGVTKTGKLVAKNANRAKNKAIRQKVKKEIIKDLNL